VRIPGHEEIELAPGRHELTFSTHPPC
jgi:hypothetical protein